MPLSKPEVALEFFGIDPEKFESDDVFRETMAKDWTKTSEAAKPGSPVEQAIFGRFNGVARSKAKKLFKELEIPTEGVEFDKIDTLDLFEPIAAGVKKVIEGREAKLTETLKGAGSEEAKKEYERQLAEQGKKVTEYEEANGKLRGEIEARDKAEKEREASGKVSTAWDQAKITGLKDITFKNDLEKTGFEAVAKTRYRVMFDEKGEQYWADAEGKRIQDGAKHQAFKDGPQLLKELAAELKVGNANPRAGEKVGRTQIERRQEEHTVKPIRERIFAKPGRVFNDAPATQ